MEAIKGVRSQSCLVPRLLYKPPMAEVLLFKAVSHGLIGLLAITFFALSLLAFISLAKNIRAGEPERDLFPFVLVIVTVCVLLALLTA